MSWYPRKTDSRWALGGSKGNKVDQAFIASLNLAPVAPGNTGIHAAITLPTAGTTVVSTGFTQPDVPRSLRLVGNQVTATGNVVIVGTNSNGEAITETIALNGTTPVETVRAFDRVERVTVPTRGAASDSITIGPGNKIGLYHTLQAPTILSKFFNGATDAGTLTTHATEVARNVYTPAGTFDGTKRLILHYAV